MRAFVTGGSGFIGLELVRQLRARGVIRSSDRVSYGVSDEKARRELGYVTRDLDAGLRSLLG